MSLARAAALTTAAAAAAAALVSLASLPPARISLTPDASWNEVAARTVAGAFHVHTSRSDGTGSMDEVAAAAARAGLQFVVFADHGDGTRAPEPPSYRSGVLCLDGVEISTSGGHYVAIGLPETPYPLGGEARDVVDDVRRLGGIGVVAHPGSAKPELAWSAWDLPFDGLEWLNADSEWRDETRGRLARALLTYPIRPGETLASLFDRPEPVLRQWHDLSARRRVVALAGADAHARVSLGGSDPYGDAAMLKMPSYETVFRTFAIRLVLDRALTTDASSDGAAVLGAIREGRSYTVIDAIASPAFLEFTAASQSGPIPMGGSLPAGDAATRFRVRATLPPNAQVSLLRTGQPAGKPGEAEHEWIVPDDPGPSAYHVEVRVPDAPGAPPVPWIVSNAIRVGGDPVAEARPASRRTPGGAISLYANGDTSGWRLEHDTESRAAVDARDTKEGREIAFRFALAYPGPTRPYASLVREIPGEVAGFRQVAFRARASRPMRVSVQLRAAGQSDRRWRRSVYLDETDRAIVVPFDEMRPVSPDLGPQPPSSGVDSLLFVVDTVNTAPGTTGIVWLDDVSLEK
jgi:hypothetical protein